MPVSRPGSIPGGRTKMTQKRPKKVELNFKYPLRYSYFICGINLKNLKAKIADAKNLISSLGFEEIHLPFLTSKDTLLSVTSDYNENALIRVYPAGNRKKPLIFSPYMLFLQALPLVKAGRFSYKEFPLKWFDVGPGYKGIIRSEKDPYGQTEEVCTIQGAFFFNLKEESFSVSKNAETLIEKVCKSSNLKFCKEKKKMFYKKESMIYSDGNKNFLAGYHLIQVKDLKKVGIQIKNGQNKELPLYMCSFAISQNCFL